MAAKTDKESTEETKIEKETPKTGAESPEQDEGKKSVEKPLAESPGTESEESKSVLTPSKEEFKEAKEETEDSESVEGSGKKKYVLFVIAAIILGIAVGAVVYFVQQKGLLGSSESKVKKEEVMEEVTESGGSEDGEKDQLERGEITLVILNGSGVAGLAGHTTTIFEELGYTVSETGNADSTTGNELYINPEVEGMVDVLLEDVKSELNISSVSGELVDSEASARIILGE